MLTEHHYTALNHILNEYQVDTIKEVLKNDEGGVKMNILTSILNNDQLTDEEKTERLVDEIIIPHNMERLWNQTTARIENGGWTIQGVYDAEPPFAYTIGLSQQSTYELIASGIDVRTLADLLNTLGEHLKSNPDTKIEDIRPETLPLFTINNGEQGRYRIVDVTSRQLFEDYMCQLDCYVEITPELTVLALILPDANNKLPGEEGYDENFVQLFT